MLRHHCHPRQSSPRPPSSDHGEKTVTLPAEALASIQTLAEAKQAEVDAVVDYNIAQHRLLAALGYPR